MDFHAARVSSLTCGECGTAIDPSPLQPLSTTTCPNCGRPVLVPAVFDKFLLIKPLGSGTTGYVLQALDEALHRQVAVKILKTGGDDTDIARECQREARTLAALNHPHIAQVYSIGEAHGQPFIVMELLNGGSAAKYLRNGQRMSEAQAIDLAIDVAEALKAAQSVGLVHMDVKPANILFNQQGEAKLIDFGAAVGRTRGGDGEQLQGTPYYVAPEIVRGHSPDFRADIYSLGATLFHLLAARPPFEGDQTNQVLAARLNGPPPNLLTVTDEVHPQTARVVARMLAAEPQDRQASYDELLAELREARAAADEPIDPVVAALAATDMAAGGGGDAVIPATLTAAARTGRITPLKADATQRATQRSPRRAVPLWAGGVLLGIIALILALVVMLNRNDDVTVAHGGPSAGPASTNHATPPVEPAPTPEPQPITPTPAPTPQPESTPAPQPTPEPTPQPTPKPQPSPEPEPKPQPKPAPQPAPTEQPVKGLVEHKPLIAHSGEYADEKLWYVLDVLRTESAAGAKMTKQPDGSILVSGVHEAKDRYIIEAWTDLSDITAFRLDVLPHESMKGKVGRDEKNVGFEVAAVTVEAAPARRPADMKPVELHEAFADNHRAGHDPKYLLDAKPDTAWSAEKELSDKPHFVVLRAKSPLGHAQGTLIRVAIDHTDKRSLGHFRLSATTHPDPAKIARPPTLTRRDKWEGGFVAVRPSKVESASGLEMQVRPDGSVLVTDTGKQLDTYTLVFEAPASGLNALRIELLTDSALPNQGPGRGAGGIFAITEIAATAASLDQPTQYKPVVFASAAADDPKAPAANVIDGNDKTRWDNLGVAGQPRTLTLVAAEPIGEKDAPGVVLTLTIQHRLGIGCLRLLATKSKDAKVLAAAPTAPGAAPASQSAPTPDAPAARTDPPDEARTEWFVNFGGPDVEEKAGGGVRQWLAGHTFKPGAFGYEGGRKVANASVNLPEMLKTMQSDVKACRFTLPEGRYDVTLYFAEIEDAMKEPGKRRFDVVIEGDVFLRAFDPVVAAKGFAKPAVANARGVRVTDGVLDIEFRKDVGVPIINAVAIERVR